MRAAAIVAVAVTHAVPGFFDRPSTPTELFIFAVTAFHVPSFLFVSGFLARADAPVGVGRVAERLRRILVPYLVASGVVWLVGLAKVTSVWNLLFRLATGGMIGHYYFVPILGVCFLLLPILSRMTDRALIVSALVLAGLSGLMWGNPAWRMSATLFWWPRDPLLQFHLGYFVLGIAAHRHQDRLTALLTGYRPLVVAAATAATLAFAWIGTWHSGTATYAFARPAYTLAVIAVIGAFTFDRPPPPLVRFLSESTLTLYLYHYFAYPLLEPGLAHAPLAIRIPVLVTIGLTFGGLVAIAGRRMLGVRSRLLLGY